MTDEKKDTPQWDPDAAPNRERFLAWKAEQKAKADKVEDPYADERDAGGSE